jgi:hypothetical protein
VFKEKPRKRVTPVVAVSLDVTPAEVSKAERSDGPEVPREAEGVPEEVKTP